MFSILYRYPFRCSLSLIDILFDVLYSQRYLLSMFFTPNRFLHLNRYLIGCFLTLKRYLIRCSLSSKDILFDVPLSSKDIIFDDLNPQEISYSIFCTVKWYFFTLNECLNLCSIPQSVFYTLNRYLNLLLISIHTCISQSVIYPLQAS